MYLRDCGGEINVVRIKIYVVRIKIYVVPIEIYVVRIKIYVVRIEIYVVRIKIYVVRIEININNDNNYTPIYSGPPLRREGGGPLNPIEWVQRDQKIRTGCTPCGELNSQQGDQHPLGQKRSGQPKPVSAPQCHDAQDYRKSPQPQQQPH